MRCVIRNLALLLAVTAFGAAIPHPRPTIYRTKDKQQDDAIVRHK